MAIKFAVFTNLHWLITKLLYKRTKFAYVKPHELSKTEQIFTKYIIHFIPVLIPSIAILFLRFKYKTISLLMHTGPQGAPFALRLCMFITYLVLCQYISLLIKWKEKFHYVYDTHHATYVYSMNMGVATALFFEQ